MENVTRWSLQKFPHVPQLLCTIVFCTELARATSSSNVLPSRAWLGHRNHISNGSLGPLVKGHVEGMPKRVYMRASRSRERHHAARAKIRGTGLRALQGYACHNMPSPAHQLPGCTQATDRPSKPVEWANKSGWGKASTDRAVVSQQT